MTTSIRTDPPRKPPGAFRVAHTGDLHLTSGPRRHDTTKALDWIVEDGRRHDVDLWINGGDLTGTHDVPHVASTEERGYLAAWFQRQAESAPVLIPYGNHDVPSDIELYRRLSGPNPIEVVVKPCMMDFAGANVCVLPFPFIAGLVNTPASMEGTVRADNDAASEIVRGLLAQWSTLTGSLRDGGNTAPLVLIGHLTIRGAMTSGDEILAGQEVELTAEDVDNFPADYVALGHIHLHQQVAQRAWYAGSPTAQTFGEPDEKGYLITDVFLGAEPQVYRRLTPARRMVTVDARWVNAGGQWQWLGSADDEIAGLPEGAEVKIRVEIPEDAATSCPVDELVAKYAAAGFHMAKPDRRLVPKTRVRSEEIQGTTTNREKLEAYWMSLDLPPKETQQGRCLEKLVALEQELAGDVTSSPREEKAA